MLKIGENLKKLRLQREMTQEQLADILGVSGQAVSRWENGTTYPDITLLPTIANIFETSVDLLLGMDTIRDERTQYNIYKTAAEFQRCGDYASAEKVYRDALFIYPNNSGMILELAGVLALQGESEEAIALIERGLPLSVSEKQKATTRALLCFLYMKCGRKDKAEALVSELPHTRESREVIQPLIAQGIDDKEIDENIRIILLGE